MSVEKLDGAKLRKEKTPYTIHSNYVLQNVCEPLPLAIWCYLTSLPDDWVVHRNQLMEHFNIGREKLGNALKFLNENKLIEYIQDKLECGKFTLSHIVVKNGIEFEVIHKNKTALLKNRTTVLPDYGKTAPTNTIRNTNEIKNTNKSFCDTEEQKKNKAVNNSDKVKNASSVKKKGWKENNQKKHAWADKAKESPRADVTKQSNSYDRDKQKLTKPTDPNRTNYQQFINSVPSLKRKHNLRKQKTNKTTELSTGTAVQSKISSSKHTSKKSVESSSDRQSCFTSPFRSNDGFMETRLSCSCTETLRLASPNRIHEHEDA